MVYFKHDCFREPLLKFISGDAAVVEICFSRHAKRRAQLYGIPESTILDSVRSRVFSQGTTEVVAAVQALEYPLKIVVSRKDNMLTVVTAYPLKKGKHQ